MAKSIKICTALYENGRIVQEVETVDESGNTTQIADRVFDLRQEGIRQALIARGWTPPDASWVKGPKELL